MNNDLIKPLFDVNNKDTEDVMVNDLMQITSFNPCLAHFLISLSEIAMVESIVGRFSGSKPSERCSPRVVKQSQRLNSGMRSTAP